MGLPHSRGRLSLLTELLDTCYLGGALRQRDVGLLPGYRPFFKKSGKELPDYLQRVGNCAIRGQKNPAIAFFDHRFAYQLFG